ncbi:MAG: thymidine kinase [Thermosediminibacteraceae bacterium]|nr:thymidine kinase [Thermosediminibacteraceae bacterium]
MAQLYFIYSTMGGGKSLELLKTAHIYECQGKKVLLFTSEKDTRYANLASDAKIGKIVARIGLEKDAWLIERVNCYDLAIQYKPNCILVDEAQFLTEPVVLDLARIVDELDIPVVCFGLKNDFMNQLFEGSRALLLYADKIQELKAVCYYCDRKATMNMRLQNGRPVFEGEQILVGGSVGDAIESEITYVPVCRKCYMSFKKQALVRE